VQARTGRPKKRLLERGEEREEGARGGPPPRTLPAPCERCERAPLRAGAKKIVIRTVNETLGANFTSSAEITAAISSGQITEGQVASFHLVSRHVLHVDTPTFHRHNGFEMFPVSENNSLK
jgi:hypothetical protein